MTDHLPDGKLPDSIASIIDDMPLVISKISAGQLMNLAREEGYSCSLDEDGDLLWKMDGYTTYLFVSKSGRIITFQTGFSAATKTKPRCFSASTSGIAVSASRAPTTRSAPKMLICSSWSWTLI